MNIATLPADDTFRTQVLRGLPESAKKPDRETGWIYGAKAMEFGPLNAGDVRPWKADMTTLKQVVSLVNQSNTGAKMRFSHPNMSRDGMGRHLGRASNARIVGDGEGAYVAIDAKLSEASKRTPSGNLYDHVLDMAAESPEDFGLSIAPILDREAMSKIEPDEDGLIPIRIKALRAIDFVDEPAATRGGLFSLDSDSPADLPAQATFLLDTFFSDASADVIRGRFSEFLDTYLRSRGEPMTTTATDNSAELAQLKAENEALKKTNTELLAKVEQQPQVAPLDADKAAAQAELNRRSEINALCQLAKVSDEDRDLFLKAGFSRADAQQWLKDSGKLQSQNPPVSEGGNDPLAAKTPEEKFGAEYDQHKDIYQGQGLSREQFIHTRMVDEGLERLKVGKAA